MQSVNYRQENRELLNKFTDCGFHEVLLPLFCKEGKNDIGLGSVSLWSEALFFEDDSDNAYNVQIIPRPIATLCFLFNGTQELVGVGYSIFSPLDAITTKYNKRQGAYLARRRAFKCAMGFIHSPIDNTLNCFEFLQKLQPPISSDVQVEDADIQQYLEEAYTLCTHLTTDISFYILKQAAQQLSKDRKSIRRIEYTVDRKVQIVLNEKKVTQEKAQKVTEVEQIQELH